MSLEAAVRSLLQHHEIPEQVIMKLASENPAASLPYHNNNHNFMLAVNAYSIGEHLGINEKLLKHLLIAGIFHDYNHTGTTLPDAVNIKRALHFLHQNSEQFTEVGLSVPLLQILIQATENPPAAKYTLPEQIMRDADLLGWCDQDTTELMQGLSEEFGSPVTKESTKAFLQSAHIYTEPARKKLVLAGWL
jgi:hypothetical protein